MTRTGYAIRPDAVQPVLRADYRGTVDGRAVDLFTLTNARGMTVRATNWGARIVQIVVPDRDGRPGDVALGYDTLAEARAGQPSMGAFIGRYANRIAEGRLVLDGQLHQLSRNDGPNHIHGGSTGSRFAVFDASQPDAATLRLRYRYADGQDGYPGNLDSEVDYHVLAQADGYDVNYVLRDWDGSLKQAACLADPASGRVMEVFTTAPGLQLYTGNHLAGAVPRDRGKGGRVYAKRHGLCLEPQHFPDSPNQPHFPGTVLEAGAEYAGCIVYRFSVDRIAS